MSNAPVDQNARSKLTIICPVFNEDEIIALFFARIKPVVDQLQPRYAIDLLFLNNASSDGTLAAIERLRAEHDFVYVITLSANVGYQRSLDCGLRHARGDAFVIIDVDGEDPSELIPDFVRGHEDGYDIVYGERIDREETLLLKSMRKVFYRVTRLIADEEIVLDMAEFCLVTDEVRRAIVNDTSSFPFIRASIGRVGYSRRGIPYKRQRRMGGRTHYNLLRISMFAVAGILSASTLLLRLPTFLLPFWLLAVGLFAALFIATQNLWFAWLTLMLICVYVFASVAFIAIYTARIYKNSLGRPNFHIDARRTFLQRE